MMCVFMLYIYIYVYICILYIHTHTHTHTQATSHHELAPLPYAWEAYATTNWVINKIKIRQK